MPVGRLSDTAQTLYIELLDQCTQAAAERLAAGAPAGSLVEKRLRGRTYWYLQRLEGDRKRQIYLGPSTPVLDRWVERVRTLNANQRADGSRRSELVRMLRAGGLSPPPSGVVTVLRSLSDAGVFDVGGVLVGTRAFQLYGPMLGRIFSGRAVSTQDIDIAQDSVVDIAVAAGSQSLDVPAELKALKLGFHAVPGLDPRRPSTSYKIRGRELRVDFLTPLEGAEGDQPVFLRSIGVAAQPLRFLDFLIAETVDVVLVARRGILLRVPDPARFALHKLWVSRCRRPDQHLRAKKDLAQAEQLLEVLVDERPEDLLRAWGALVSQERAAEQVAATWNQLGSNLGRRLERLMEYANETNSRPRERNG